MGGLDWLSRLQTEGTTRGYSPSCSYLFIPHLLCALSPKWVFENTVYLFPGRRHVPLHLDLPIWDLDDELKEENSLSVIGSREEWMRQLAGVPKWELPGNSTSSPRKPLSLTTYLYSLLLPSFSSSRCISSPVFTATPWYVCILF